jgi:hypothetical protein
LLVSTPQLRSLVGLHLGEHRVVALLQTRLTGEWLRLVLSVAPAPPPGGHGIVDTPGTFVLPPLADRDRVDPAPAPAGAAFARALDAHLAALAAAETFSGAVLVARDGTGRLHHSGKSVR